MIDTLLEPQTMPAWLRDILPKRGDRPINHKRPVAEGHEGAVSEGQRNNTLTSLAGTMRRPGMSIEAIEAALLTENAGYNPPLSEDEVRKIARSVGRYQPADIWGRSWRRITAIILASKSSAGTNVSTLATLVSSQP